MLFIRKTQKQNSCSWNVCICFPWPGTTETGAHSRTDAASGLDYSFYGLYGGVDTWLDNHRLVGIALGLSRTDADPAAGDIRHDSLELALYGRWLIDNGYLNADLSAGYHQTDSARQVTTGTASGEYDSQSAVLALEAGRIMYKGENITLSPFVGADYAHLKRDAFSETGAGPANLNVDSETLESLRSRLGLRFETKRTTGEDRSLQWDIELAWAHEFRDTSARIVAGFDGAPAATFIVNGPELDRDRALLGAGLTTHLGKFSQLRIGYNGEVAGSDTRHSINARYRMQW